MTTLTVTYVGYYVAIATAQRVRFLILLGVANVTLLRYTGWRDYSRISRHMLKNLVVFTTVHTEQKMKKG
jgi:hypothetical protein